MLRVHCLSPLAGQVNQLKQAPVGSYILFTSTDKLHSGKTHTWLALKT